MADLHTPIDPATLDRAALIARFWAVSPAVVERRPVYWGSTETLRRKGRARRAAMLQMQREGHTIREIARAFDIEMSTVKDSLAHARREREAA